MARVNRHSRDLIIDRKNRAILANSYISMKRFPFLHNFAKKYLESNSEEIDKRLSKLKRKELLEFNQLLPRVLSMCKDEWIGGSNPVEIIEDQEERNINCDLCGQKEIKLIFNIKNKINGSTMIVGSTCINEFGDIELKRGKSRQFLIKEAKRAYQLKKLSYQINNISRKVESWEKKVENYDIVIPNRLSNSYFELGKKLKNAYEGYLNEENQEKNIKIIKKALQEQKKYFRLFKEYVHNHKHDRYVATKEILKWLKKFNENNTISRIKESGYIDFESAKKIKEPNFIKMFIEDMNQYLNQIGIKISHVEQDRDSFVLKDNEFPGLELFCSINKFIETFGWVLFDLDQSIAINKKNIYRISNPNGRESTELLIRAIRKKLKGTQYKINLYYHPVLDFYDLNQVDVINKNEKDYIYVVNLDIFIKELKHYVHDSKNSFMSNFEYLMDHLEHGEFSKIKKSKLRELRSTSIRTF